MDVEIAYFPETKIAVAEHHGSPELEYETANKLIAWRIANRLAPSAIHRSFGIHYNDPQQVDPSEYRVDLCVSVEHEVSENEHGVINKVIPAVRCAKVRHYGSRSNVCAAQYLYECWLPASGEQCAEFPIFFHYVNVGPEIKEKEMVTDVYLPLA